MFLLVKLHFMSLLGTQVVDTRDIAAAIKSDLVRIAILVIRQHSVLHSNLSGSFTFAFSWYLGLEGFTYGKILGIFACFMGAVCVGLHDSESGAAQSEHNIFGDVVALFGALCYGMYTTVLKYKVSCCTVLSACLTVAADTGLCCEAMIISVYAM